MFLADKLNKGSGSPVDAQFNYVTMLLHGDGTNGAQNNTFLDSSTNNFTITRNGNTTQGSFSPYGSNWSNYFDGSTSYLSVPSSSALAFGTGDFTVELWVNYYSDTGNYVLYDGRGTSILTQIGFVIYLAGGTLYAQQGTTPIVTTTSPTANAWHHIAFSRSGSSNKLFVDGTQVGTTVTDSTNYSTAYSVGIGSTLDSSYTSSYDLNGYLSNVRVVKGTAVYTSNFTPSTTPLTAITNTSLLTCQSNRFVDNSTNNFAITVTGTPSVQRFNPFGASTAYSTSVIGGSGYFDGTGDYLQVANNAAFDFGSGDWTIEFWMYGVTQALGNLQPIINKGTDFGSIYAPYDVVQSGLDVQLYLNGTSSGWNIAGGVTIGTIALNEWTHFAITRSGTTFKAFKNGVQTWTTTNSQAMWVNTYPFRLAATSDAGSFWSGYLSDVRIVKGTAVYTSAFTPPTAPLTAITNTSLLTNMTNGAIFDNAMMNDLETVGNAQISTSVKKYGTGSLAFDGTGETCKIPNNPWMNLGSGNWTIEFWVYANNTSRADVVSKGDASTYVPYLIQLSGGQINVYFSDNGSGYSFTLSSSAGAYTTGNWVHVAVVRNGNTVSIYSNGTSVGSGSYSGTLFTGNTDPFGIGGDSSGSYVINGYMDEVRITKGYARYTANFTPPTAAFPNTGPI